MICGMCATVQKLEVSPAYLRNDGNEYLHYTDDWYILASKPDQYVVIYYRGNNDAWKGYGGATVYTRCWDMSNNSAVSREPFSHELSVRFIFMAGDVACTC